jgi:hypothetical protein
MQTRIENTKKYASNNLLPVLNRVEVRHQWEEKSRAGTAR